MTSAVTLDPQVLVFAPFGKDATLIERVLLAVGSAHLLTGHAV